MDFNHRHLVQFESIDDIVSNINDGDTVAIGGFWFVRLPVALVNALIKKGVKDLTLVAHASGLLVDQLIEAKLVKKVIFSFVSLDVFGLPPFFRKAIEHNDIEWEEWPALRMVHSLQAGKQNLPYAISHPPIGSDFLKGDQKDYFLTNCPFTGRNMAVIRALQPDVALLHTQRADRKGNLQFEGALGLDKLIIGAAKKTFVSVEEIVPEQLFSSDPRTTIIPHFLVNRICHVPGGAYPSSCLPFYITDYWQLSNVIEHAREKGFYQDVQRPNNESIKMRIESLHRFVEVDASDFQKNIMNSNHSFETEKEYTVDELMAVVLSKHIKDETITTVGSNTPLSMVAYLLAKKTHAKNVVLIPYTGLNDISNFPISLSFSEIFSYKESSSHWGIEDLWEWLYQRSLTSVEFGSTAQIDQTGAINNSIIGSLENIKVRLPGQAGLADVINLHQNFYSYITKQEKRSMVEKVDYISGIRHYLSKDDREKVNLPHGTTRIFTNLGIYELDEKYQKIILTHIHPGVKLEEVRQKTGFNLQISPRLQVTEQPTDAELYLIRHEIDPFGFRKLEFLSGKERQKIIKIMLTKEQLTVFKEEIIKF